MQLLSKKIGTYQGVPIKVNITFFYFLALSLGLVLIEENGELGQAGITWRVIGGIVTWIGLGFSILFHEFAHVKKASNYGVKTKEVLLWFLGGVALTELNMRTAEEEFKVAVAGPLSSLCLAGVFGLASWLLSGYHPIFDVLSYLTIVNIALAVFNCVPVFPMDGGRMCRALLWMVHRSYWIGIYRASYVCIAASILMGFWSGMNKNLIMLAMFGFTLCINISELLKHKELAKRELSFRRLLKEISRNTGVPVYAPPDIGPPWVIAEKVEEMKRQVLLSEQTVNQTGVA